MNPPWMSRDLLRFEFANPALESNDLMGRAEPSCA